MIGTNNFINECKKDKVTYKEYIVIDDVPVEIKAQMYQTAYRDTTFFGTFNLNYIKFKTENNISYKNKDFVYYKTVNGETQQIGHYYVTEVIDNDTEEEIQITAFDDGIKFNNKYTTSLNYRSGTITLYNVLQECCTNCNVVLKNESITNGSFIVDSNQFEETATYGDVICAIAQMSGGFAFINYEGKLEIRFTNQTNEIIEDYVELEDKRDTHPITSVLIGIDPDIEGEYAVREDSSLVEQYGRNWLKIYGNPFAYTVQKREYLIDAIFNQVKGFGYSAFTVKDSFLPYFELGDLVQFKNKQGQIVSSIILRIETDYDSVELSAPSITNAEVDYIKPTSDSEITRNTRIQVDKAQQEITSMAGVITEQNTKISRITQTVDELNSKISEIADITISHETNSAKLIFEEINASEPISINIHPIVEHISYTYPYTGLFPSNYTYLKTRTLRFTNTSAYEQTTDIKYTSYRKYYTYDSQNNKYDLLIKGTDYQVGDIISGTIYQNTEVDYEIPSNLYYYDENNYDEFILDYGDGIEKTCIVNKKVGINADGSTYLLDEEQIITYPYPTISLTDGDYEVTLLGYEVGYLFVRLMVQNIYTTQYATKTELNTSITQTASSINLSVDQKLSNYSTTNQMNSAINLSANSITSSVSATYATKASLNSVETTLTASLELKVNTKDLISEINASADVIRLTAGRLIISSGNFQLDSSGNITCTGGTIGGLTITSNSLYKNYISSGSTYRSGLNIPDTTAGNTTFLFAGYPTSGRSYAQSNIFLQHNGNLFFRSGCLQMIYEPTINPDGSASWINALTFSADGINRFLSNGNRWTYEGIARNQSDNPSSHSLFLYDAPGYSIKDALHNQPLMSMIKTDAVSQDAITYYWTDISVWGTRQVSGVNNSIYVQGYEVATNASDKRLKENIKNSKDNALEKINNIKIRSFDWRTDKHLKQGGQHVNNGYVAQEVQKVDETLVNYNEEFDTYQMNELNLNALQMKAIQELYQEIQELKERMG
jgi:hypothetical protein